MSERLLFREKYLERIRPYYEMDTVKVIAGPRRAGKSVMNVHLPSENNYCC